MGRPFAAPAVRFCAVGAPEPGEATADLTAVFFTFVTLCIPAAFRVAALVRSAFSPSFLLVLAGAAPPSMVASNRGRLDGRALTPGA